jgi:hypothetical protein
MRAGVFCQPRGLALGVEEAMNLISIIGRPVYLSAALALAVAALGAAPASAATPFGKNLVKNSGAESGSPGIDVPNWEIDPDFSVGAYGGLDMPSKKQGKAVDGEKQLFATGPYVVNFDTCGGARQAIKLKGITSQIDSGGVSITLSAAMGTKTKEDTAFVIVQFRDSNNHQVGSNLSINASTKAKMVEKLKKATVPKKTRAINVLLQGDLLEGTCDAFFDNVSVVLD